MATDQEILKYYSDLLILQFKDKPKAVATVQTYGEAVIGGQLPDKMQNAFDIETAVGNQLDILGKYAGVSRDGYTFSGAIVLGDEDFRKLIKIKIFLNNSAITLDNVQTLIETYFKDLMFVFDYKDMSISYYLSSLFGSQDLVEVFITKGLLPVPMAVGLGSTIYFPTLEFYGFRTYEAEAVNSFPMNTYEEYNESWPWLSYAYAIDATTTVEQMLLTEDGLNIIVQENGDELYT